jgi:hypothetical protein
VPGTGKQDMPSTAMVVATRILSTSFQGDPAVTAQRGVTASLRTMSQPGNRFFDLGFCQLYQPEFAGVAIWGMRW